MSLDKDGYRDGNRDRDIRDLEATSINSTIGPNLAVDSSVDSVPQATNQITHHTAGNDAQANSAVESAPSIKANLTDQLDGDFLLRYKVGRIGLTEAPIQTPKLAFLFMTRGPLPLAPFWERFFKGHEGFFSMYIHTAREFRYKPGELPSAFEGAHIPSQDVHWGEISMVDAERRLLANALLDPGNARFILVSESCAPLFNFTFVYEYLMASPEAYVRLKNEPGANGRGRWRREFLPLVRLEDWRKGGQWFAMDREAARVIVADDIFYPLFKRFCRPPCYADEHYMPSMLKVLMPGNVANRTVTWTDWSKPGAAHPAQFGAGQVTEKLIERMRGPPSCRVADGDVPCFLFARKLMPGALTDLLRLADYIGLYPRALPPPLPPSSPPLPFSPPPPPPPPLTTLPPFPQPPLPRPPPQRAAAGSPTNYARQQLFVVLERANAMQPAGTWPDVFVGYPSVTPAALVAAATSITTPSSTSPPNITRTFSNLSAPLSLAALSPEGKAALRGVLLLHVTNAYYLESQLEEMAIPNDSNPAPQHGHIYSVNTNQTIQIHIESDKSLVFRMPANANTPASDSPYTAYSVTAAATVLPALKDVVADGKLSVQGADHVLLPPTGPANAVGRVFNANVQAVLSTAVLTLAFLFIYVSFINILILLLFPSRRPLASPIVASARPLTSSVNQTSSSFARSTVSSRIQRCSHVVQGIRAVESFDTSFELDPQAKEVLVYLLSSDVFLQQVASQPGVPAGITGTEFTGELFTPVPWSPTTRFGMPQELEKYNEGKDNYIHHHQRPVQLHVQSTDFQAFTSMCDFQGFERPTSGPGGGYTA
ncbi:unnamed protein product [Closterium sp. Yama58-4]|nr:unnamed protein product [Closterium sp. Yama58-4]